MVCCHKLNTNEVPNEQDYYDSELNLQCFEYRNEGYRWVFTPNIEYNKWIEPALISFFW